MVPLKDALNVDSLCTHCGCSQKLIISW